MRRCELIPRAAMKAGFAAVFKREIELPQIFPFFYGERLAHCRRNAFLARAARGEPIGGELLRRLREVGGVERPAAAAAAA